MRFFMQFTHLSMLTCSTHTNSRSHEHTLWFAHQLLPCDKCLNCQLAATLPLKAF